MESNEMTELLKPEVFLYKSHLRDHRGRIRKLSEEEFVSRFWERTDVMGEDDCWVWKGYIKKEGYGQVSHQGKNVLAHRVSYTISIGEIPEGLLVLHKCDNPPCVNPKHLFIGTEADNMRDRDIKGRGNQPKGEKSGTHKLTETKVKQIRDKYSTGEFTKRELGREFGVTPENIHSIVRRETWRHI